MHIELIDPKTHQPFESTVAGGRTFFLLTPGQQFFIRVVAKDSRRHEFVLALDGRDTLTNLPATSLEQSGIISERVYICRGWRVSDLEVCAFIAAPLGAGLTTAERNGSIDMAGLIFAAVYDELAPLRAGQYLGGRDIALRGGGGLGTAAGQQITDQLGTTSWTRSSAFEVQAIEYGDREHLAARGIVFPRLHPGWPLAGTRFAHPSTL